jgi:hypothetical protein
MSTIKRSKSAGASAKHLANRWNPTFENKPSTNEVFQALCSDTWILLFFFYAVEIIMRCSFDSSAGVFGAGIPKSREDFGYWYEGDWILPAGWRSAFSGGPAAS